MFPAMPSMGGTELLIVLSIILLFFGAKRVPELGRSLGRSMQEFRKGAAGDYGDKEEEQLRAGAVEEKPPLGTTAVKGEQPSPQEAPTSGGVQRVA